jgi:DNA polymerase III epsilon subunit family exonuclease
MTTWVAFDTETTGIEPGSRVLDLGAIAFDDRGTVISTFEQLVNPGMPVPEDVVGLHGINDRMLDGQPSSAQVLAAFLEWLPGDGTLIAHNAPYDCGILTWEFQRAGLPVPRHRVVDTCQMARSLAETQDNKLQTLIRHFRLMRSGNAHRALPDADAVRQYFIQAKPRIDPVAASWTARYACPGRLPVSMTALPDWIAKATRIRIRYIDAKGQKSERELTPFGYATMSDRLMVHGWCHLAGARRTFSADRMRVVA